MRAPLLLATLALLGCGASGPTVRSAPTPEAARLVTDDLARFYAVFDALPDSVSARVAARRFRERYFAPGTTGLRAFRDRTGSDDAFAEAVLERRRFYAAIRGTVLDRSGDAALMDSVRAAYRALAAVYPEATFPDVYAVVGRLSTGGTVKTPGVVIGEEHGAATADTPVDELTAWQRSRGLSPRGDRLPLIVHEAMHAQQRPFRQRTRGRRAVAEGCPDYLAERFAGRHPNAAAERWAAPRRAELTSEFMAAWDSEDLGDWFFRVPDREGDPGRPVDLGYTVGKWICEAYVERAADPEAALREVIRLDDPDRILRESGLAPEASGGAEAP